MGQSSSGANLTVVEGRANRGSGSESLRALEAESRFPRGDTWDTEDEYYENNPPIVYFIKGSDGDFHARSVNESTYENLEKFPKQIRTEWVDAAKRNNFGIIDFDAELTSN